MYLSTEQLLSSSLCRPVSGGGVLSLHEKGSSEINEDVLLVHGDTFGVFDGATSLGPVRFKDGKTGGLLAATIAAETFKHDNRPLPLVAAMANKRIAEASKDVTGCNGDKSGLWSTSMAVVRVNDTQLEYCHSGDAVLLFLFEDGGYQVVSSEVDIDRETLSMWKEMEWCKGLKIHDALADQIRNVRQRMNIDYGVLNGEPEALGFLKHGEIDLLNVRDVVLFTDGLFLPREEPAEEQDWQEFIDLYRQGGLHRIYDHNRTLQESDPDCRTYPRFKKHDDIAALALSSSYLLKQLK